VDNGGCVHHVVEKYALECQLSLLVADSLIPQDDVPVFVDNERVRE